jgi:preprotein translocase subunit SecE
VNILEDSKNPNKEIQNEETQKDQKEEKQKEAKQKSKKPAKKSDKSPVQRFFENLAAEFRKIIWPSRNELIKQTVVVIIISLFMGAVIFGMDFVFNYLESWITGFAS